MGHKNKNLAGFLLSATLLLFLLVVSAFISTPVTHAAAGVNTQLSFEGKIVKTDNTNIADSTRNVEFKIYQDGNNMGVGSTLKWTEDYLVGGSGGITFTSGTFQVNLGSVNAFASQVNWNQDTLWLSIQVGNTSSCTISTDFHTDCGGDTEMKPYIRLTAVPYANNAAALSGLVAGNFVQLAQGLQTDTSTANASIAINKNNASGTPNILQLQKASTDVFVINNSGFVTLQPSVSLVASQSHITQTLTAGQASGTVDGYKQTITVAPSAAAVTNGFEITMTDDDTTTLNVNAGVKVSLAGNNTWQDQYGVDASVNRGTGVRGVSSGYGFAAGTDCGAATASSIGVCGYSSYTGGQAIGVNGVSDGADDADYAHGAGVIGTNSAAGVVGKFYAGVRGFSVQTANAAYTSIGTFGMAGGGSSTSTAYAGYFMLAPSGNAATGGAALYASNTDIAANIFQLQDNGSDVVLVADGGALTITPVGNNIGTIVRQTSGTATSGDVFDIQGANGTSHFIRVTETAANQGSVAVTSLGSNDLTLDSGSATIKLGSTTTALQKSASAFALDLSNGGSDSTLTVSNTGGAGNIILALDSGGAFKVGSSTGSTISACGSNNYISSFASIGGIITGGSCGTIASTNLSDTSNIARLDAANTFAPTTNNVGTTIKQTSGTATSGNVFDVQGANGSSHFITVTETAANAGSISLTSLGSNSLTLDAGGGTVILGSNTTTLQKSGTAFTLDLNNSSDSTLTLTNAGSGVGSLSVEGDVAVGSGRVFKVNTTSGVAASACSSGQFVQGQAATGGIITTAGSCVNVNSLTTLAQAYSNGSASGDATLQLASGTGKGTFIVQDAASTVGSLFTVQKSDSSAKYLDVTNSAITIEDNGASHRTAVSIDITNHILKVFSADGTTNYAAISATNTDATIKSNTGTTNIGNGTGAVTVNAGSGAAVNITGHTNSTWQTDAGTLTIQAGTSLSLLSTSSNAISLDSSTTGDVNIGNNANAKAITLGNSQASTTVDIDAGTGASAIEIGNTGNAHGIQIGTGAAVQTVVLGSTNGASVTTIQGGSGNIILNSGNGHAVIIGSSSTDANAIVLVVDSYNNGTDPASGAINGAMYYNTSLNKFRCYENSAWVNCIGSGTSSEFGDGSDGTVSMNGTNTFASFASTSGVAPNLVYTLTRDVYATTMTISSGKILNTAGFRIFVTGTLTNPGTIQNLGGVGGNASAGAVGAGGIGTAGYYMAGTTGGAGGSNGVGNVGVAATASTTFGAIGGTGGTNTNAGGAGGTVSAPPANNGGTQAIKAYAIAVLGMTRGNTGTATGIAGGTGGGGGGSSSTGNRGGGGGSGGGVIFIAAKVIDNTSGTISAAGGQGGNGNASGGVGGGGGGGLVMIFSSSYTGNAATAAGGAIGATGSQGSATAGSAGLVLNETL